MPRLPTTDLTSDAIKAFLGITGEITLDDICKSDRVRGEYFDINYLHGMAQAYYGLLSALAGFPLAPAGIREGVRLAPQDISNFRNYGYDATGYSIIAFSGEHNDNKILKYNNDEYWNDFYSAPIRDMRTAVRAPDGILWVGGQVANFIYTNERGLFSFNGSTWRRYTTPEITGEYVYAIELGTDPYMWVGTEHGFSIFDRTTNLFEHYYIGAGTVPTGKLPSNVINCLAYNSDDESMWVGTSNGLIHITDIADPTAWNLLKTTDGLPGNNVKCLAIGPGGDCWAGFDGQGISRITESGGVYAFDNINTSSVPGILTNHIRKIAVEQDTYNVWAATNLGIQYFEITDGYSNITYLRIADGLPSDEVYTVKIDHYNRKWFGFDDHIGMIVDIADEIRVWGQWHGSDELHIHEFLVDYEPIQVINEVVIGNQTWMTDNWRGNSRFMFPSGTKSKVYNYNEYNREFLGGLFTWRQITEEGFAPEGYHVPTFTEWWELIEFCGGLNEAAKHLKSTSTIHESGWLSNMPETDNSTGFNAIGAGYANVLSYYDINEMAQFWTASENEDVPENGVNIGLYYDSNEILIESHNKDDYWFPVRFIKNKVESVSDIGALYNWYVVNGGASPDPHPYGALYNLYAATKQVQIHDKTYGGLYNQLVALYNTGGASVAPTGWHVPSLTECQTLYTYLGGDSVAGGKMKETGTTHWASPNIDASNSSGFNAYPGILREVNGNWITHMQTAAYWNTSPSGNQSCIYLYNSSGNAGFGYYYYTVGMPIRCIKNSTSLTNGQTSTVTDIEGNIYNTICIGTQEWMSENLRTEHYNDNTPIPIVDDSADWIDPADAQMTYPLIDIPMLPPTGWHVPTYTEWLSLRTYLGGYDVAGGKLKETGTTHWNSPNTYADNSSGFTALGGGVRNADGTFSEFKNVCNLHSSTTILESMSLSYDGATFGTTGSDENQGFSIRCLLDGVDPADPGTVTDIDGNVYTTVKIGTQVWMAANLKVTHYNDGTDIPIITNDALWAADTAGAMCYYDNEAPTGNIYLLPPSGWHVPTSAEFDDLKTELGGTAVAGGHMKIKDYEFWDSPNTGADNSSGFSAKGAGERSADGVVFSGKKVSTRFLVSDDLGDPTRSVRLAYNSASFVTDTFFYKNAAGSVRCVKDSTDLEDGEYGTLIDIDGNIYQTKCYNGKEWMIENLRVLHYNDGTLIPLVSDPVEWESTATGKICWYDNIAP